MKSCDEMVNSLLERRDEYNVEQKRKKKNLARGATFMGCAVLAAVIGLGLQKSGVLEKSTTQYNESPMCAVTKYTEPLQQEAPDYTANSEGQTTMSPFQAPGSDAVTGSDITCSSSDGEGKKLFAINEITGTVSACPMDLSPYNKEVWNLEKVAEYLSFDIAKVTEEIADETGLSYNGNNEFYVYRADDGTFVEDRMSFGFSGSDGARLYVFVSRLREPCDCIYYSNTKTPSYIGIPETGETVVLYVYRTRDKDSNEEYDSYIIDFQYRGNYYRTEAENVSPKILDSVVRSIVKNTWIPPTTDCSDGIKTATAYTDPIVSAVTQ